MNARRLSARLCAALLLALSLIPISRPAYAEAHVLLHTERSLVLRVRDLSGDGDRDVVYFHPDVKGQFDGPGRAIVRTWTNLLLADFHAASQEEVWALAATHPADVDNNQRVNNDDLTALLQKAGPAPHPGAPGDLNRDSVVDEVDGGILMAALDALDGAGWVRHDQTWPSAFDPQLEGGERAENCWAWAPGDGGFWLCGPGQGRPGPDDPDGGDNDDNTPLGPDDGEGGGGGPGDDDGGGGDDDEPDDPVNCAEVTVTIGAIEGYIPVRDRAETLVTFSAVTTGPDGAFFWTVGDASSAVEGGPNFSVAVNEGGALAVSVRFVASNGCEAFDSIDVPVCSFDLAVDIDENGHIDESDVDAEAQAPGVILLANNFDEDGDGVEGFADGFDWNPLLEQDDSDDTTTFVPITLHVSGVESGNARIRFDYPASDPVALTIGNEGWTLPPGRIRLWRVDGSQTRNSALLIDGGDYIAPGEYTLADLGIFGPDDITLYVESIRESTFEGDIVIAAAVSADEESGWVSSDAVRGTGVRMTFAGRNLLDTSFLEPVALVATHLAPLGSAPIAGTTTGPWREFKIYIYDPRATLAATQIGDVWLPLHHDAAARRWTSDPFWIWIPGSPDHTAGAPTSTPVPILQWPPLLRWQYALAGGGNRDDAIFKEIEVEVLDHMAPEQRAIAEATRDVIAEMRAEGWVSRNTADAGDYGKEVHRRVAQRLAGRPNTYWSVWLNPNTREIVSIGTQPSPNAGMRELDVVCTEPGYTPQVGQQLDRTRVLTAAEIKTSITGWVDPAHRRFYNNAVGSDKWYVQNPVCRYTAGGWVNVEKGVRTLQVAAVLGMASSAFACANPARYDELRDDMLYEWEQAQRPDLDDLERTARFAVFALAFRAYMINFTPDETAVNVLTYGAIMRHLGYEPHPDFEE